MLYKVQELFIFLQMLFRNKKGNDINSLAGHSFLFISRVTKGDEKGMCY